MPKGPTFAPFFQRLIDDPDAALEALREDPQRFESDLLTEEKGRLSADATIPIHDALGMMIFDVNDRRVPMAGPAWLPPADTFDALIGDTPALGLASLAGVGGLATPATWAPMAETADWNLPPTVRGVATAHPHGKLVLIAGGPVGEAPLDAACRMFGLTDLERRVIRAVVRSGSARRAAVELGIGYATVRETLARTGRRLNVPNLPGIVRAVVAASFGILPDEGEGGAILADMLPLSERQRTIAVFVAAGLTREQTANAIGAGLAVVKKELEIIFDVLGVASAAELARLVTAVRALRLFARSTDSAVGFQTPAIEPTRLTPRTSGAGAIAWSDYGPRSGRPVLVVHSNWSCRSVPRPLVRELQRQGFRPIAIDRPGFGATAVGRSTATNPFGQAVEDACAILDLIRCDRIPIVARCGAQFVMAMAHAAPQRVGPVVLVSPTPQTSETGLRHGIAGVVKESFYRRPRLIEFFFRIISAQVTLPRLETLTRAIVEGSPTDEALCDDPAFMRDRLREIRPLSTGNMAGAAYEERIISQGGYPFATINARDWTILQGDTDPHNSFDEVHEYWSRLIPNGRFERVADGGRFMTSSHPDLIVNTLIALSTH